MESQTVTLAQLQRLAESSAPIVGLPIPGERAFAFERKIIGHLIAGLNGDTHADLYPAGNGHGQHPVLEINSPAARRSYSLIGRNLASRGKELTSLARWAERQRIARGKAHTDRFGNSEGTPAAKLAKTVPPFLRKELRTAEEELNYRRLPKANRAGMFKWLHPAQPEPPTYDYVGPNWDRVELTPEQGQAELARRVARARAAVLYWYESKNRRRDVGRAVAQFFTGARTDFNGVRRLLKAVGFEVKPWSAQPVAVRQGHFPERDAEPFSTWRKHGADAGAQAQFLKAIGKHLGIRKPASLTPWPETYRGTAGEVKSGPAKHNASIREFRQLQARVESLKAQIAALESGAEYAEPDPEQAEAE